MEKINTCTVCHSENLSVFNTYKHWAHICNDCSCVSHLKKTKYLVEYLIPRGFAKGMLPTKAFLRLYSDKGDYDASEFYDSTAFDSTEDTAWRDSEVLQVRDQLALIEFKADGKKVLDISGGPGYVGRYLKKEGAEVTVTEFAESTVRMMNEIHGIKSLKFDYTSDDLTAMTSDRFDLIMIRSSIIFCPNLDELVIRLKQLLAPEGIIFLESILPSYGEIFWWQQLEFKFPKIYSQETIEKVFYKNGFFLKHGYRDYGSYLGVKFRSYNNLSRHLFTWMIEYPMLLLYRFLNLPKRANIDSSMNHKMITQFWSLSETPSCVYKNYHQGGAHKSKTFGYTYNGYLEKKQARQIMT